MSEEKSATEILLEIKNTVDVLLQYYSNQDFLIKTILSKQSEMVAKLNDLANNNTKPTASAPANQSIKLPPQDTTVVIPKKQPVAPVVEAPRIEAFLEQRAKESNEDIYKFEDYEAPKAEYQLKQRLLMENGKNLFMAKVTFFKNGNKVKDTMSKSNGFWECKLEAGKYIVKILRQDPATKTKIEFEQEILVDKSEELPAISLKTNKMV